MIVDSYGSLNTLYSLEKLIEWKLKIYKTNNPDSTNSLLAREIN